MKDGSSLVLSFSLASGAKKKLIINNAKQTQNPTDVKALMQHIVNANIIKVAGDSIIAIDSAWIQKIVTQKIAL